MTEEIEVKDTLTDALRIWQQITDALKDAGQKIEDLDSTLGGDEWQGSAHLQCVKINQAIAAYYGSLLPICDEFKLHVETLKQDADSFLGSSENMSLIRNI